MLFEENIATLARKDQPLPARVRPTSYSNLLGQEKIWSPKSPLRQLVESETFSSLIFWGPPGTGKTTLSQMIGKSMGRHVAWLSAVDSGVKDIRREIKESIDGIKCGQPASLIFMDEVHRLSKNQQDVLLPALEAGTIKFIGATTENPAFEVNHAVNSRSLVFRFESLGQPAIIDILERAIDSDQTAIDRKSIADDVLELIAINCAGDARKALNLLDAILCSYNSIEEQKQPSSERTPLNRNKPPASVHNHPEAAHTVSAAAANTADETPKASPQPRKKITCENLGSLKDSLTLRHDKKGDNHFDLVSALIKSIRASHPDAAVYYLARMLQCGEDPIFVARRLMISASEDIGNANPTALLMATSGLQACQSIGMPEVRIILSQVATYLAASPKSNRSYLAINQAFKDVERTGSLEIPLHLRNAPAKIMKDFGYGKGYVSPHDSLAAAQSLTYLPRELSGRKYYSPSDTGVEKQLKLNLQTIRPNQD